MDENRTEWLKDFILPGEIVTQIKNGPVSFEARTCTPEDPYGGRVLNITALGDSMVARGHHQWIYSKYSGHNGIVEVFDSIPLGSAREAVDLVAPQLLREEYIDSVSLQPDLADIGSYHDMRDAPLKMIVSARNGPTFGGRIFGIKSNGKEKVALPIGVLVQ